MEDNKSFAVIVDGVQTANVTVYQTNTLGRLKDYISGLYPGNLTIYIANTTTLSTDESFRNIAMSTYWPYIVFGVFLIDTKQSIIPINKIQPLNRRGEIRVRNVERGVSYPAVAGFKNIPAWSRGAAPWKQLSPFEIGPVVFQEDGVMKQSPIFENFWQSAKAWQHVDKQNGKNWKWPADVHIGPDGNPNQAWYKWHNALLSHNLPVRRPNGKIAPLYAWWKGQKLGIVEARKQIYIPYLQQLYRAHRVYQQLLTEVRNGQNIILLEPDGPHFSLYPDGMTVDLQLLYRLQDVTQMRDFPDGERHENPGKYCAYGHGLVIALTLLQDLSQ